MTAKRTSDLGYPLVWLYVLHSFIASRREEEWPKYLGSLGWLTLYHPVIITQNSLVATWFAYSTHGASPQKCLSTFFLHTCQSVRSVLELWMNIIFAGASDRCWSKNWKACISLDNNTVWIFGTNVVCFPKGNWRVCLLLQQKTNLHWNTYLKGK